VAHHSDRMQLIMHKGTVTRPKGKRNYAQMQILKEGDTSSRYLLGNRVLHVQKLCRKEPIYKTMSN
jgi:hypothetical protein